MRPTPTCGLETEYGLMVEGARTSQTDAALAFLDACAIQPRVRWHGSGESPTQDARVTRPEESSPPRTGPWTLTDGFLLGNGARFYVDLGHPEYCTPECHTPEEAVASDKAGERLLDACRARYERELPDGQRLSLFKNNSDHRGDAYGCHENYLVPADVYERLFEPRSVTLLGHLVPFLVSRIVVCGSGKVGSENGHRAVAYQISQRADFVERLLGLETTRHRPLVNTRDEPHADAARMRRLHVIVGDANLAERSTYLKVGSTQIVLAMLNAGVTCAELTLADPIDALHRFSTDPTCQARARLEDARELTAVEMQRTYVDTAERHLDALGAAPWIGQCLERWRAVLDGLGRDPLSLSDSLDWVAKWAVLDGWRQRRGLTWQDPALVELDVRYHDIDPGKSLFHVLQRSGRMTRVVDESLITRAMEWPVAATRASARASAMRETADPVVAGTWSELVRNSGARVPFSIE